MEEESNEQKISQRLDTELMDPGKRPYVQQYLKDISKERYSLWLTTETSDRDYETRTTASETVGKFHSTIFIMELRWQYSPGYTSG